MRKQPELGPPQITHRNPDTVIKQTRQYELITPLFGGGAITQQHDEVTTIRGTEIRGQLRYWWRATCGGKYKTIAEMRIHEEEIWGKANTKKEQGPKHEDTIQIEVEANRNPEQIAPFRTEINNRNKPVQKSNNQSGIHPYGAFPVQLTREELVEEKPQRTISKEGIVFTLKITFPRKNKKDVDTALWAWETFGGLGARTRRGFGALHLTNITSQPPIEGTNNNSLPPSPELACEWLKSKLQEFNCNNLGIPYISKKLDFTITTKGDKKPMKVWYSLIKSLYTFRQNRGTEIGKSSGRSNWPEAEAVRHYTRQYRSDLRRLNHPQKFPRAVFGLPIIFHFIRDPQNRDNHPPSKDPEDTTLQAKIEGSDRLASPLILKPLFCQNNQACGLAVIMDGYQIPPLELKEENGRLHDIGDGAHQLTERDLAALTKLKLENTDILKAFLATLKKTENDK